MEIKLNDCTITYEEQHFNDSSPQLNVSVVFNEDFVSKTTQNVCKNYAKVVSLNGFRKGKATKGVIEGMVGKSIYNEVFSNFANTRFLESCSDKIIFTDQHCVKEDHGKYMVDFVAWKEPIVTISDEALNKTEFDVTDKFDLDKYVNDRIDTFVKLNPYLRAKTDDAGTPLPSTVGDMVEVFVDCYIDNNHFMDGCEKSTNIRLLDGTVSPPELYEQLLNRLSGDKFDIVTSNIPQSFKQNGLSGKKMELHVKVNNVYKCEESKPDDDMAITAGYKDFDEWKAALHDKAIKLKENFDVMAKKQAIVTHLTNTAVVTPFPPKWVHIKASEFNDKDAGVKIEEVAKQMAVIKYVGGKIGIEWDDVDKNINDRNESTYVQKVLNVLVDKATFNGERTDCNAGG